MTRRLTAQAVAAMLGIAGGWYGAVTHYGARVDQLASDVSELREHEAATYKLLAAVAVKVGIPDTYIAAVTPLITHNERGNQ